MAPRAEGNLDLTNGDSAEPWCYVAFRSQTRTRTPLALHCVVDMVMLLTYGLTRQNGDIDIERKSSADRRESSVKRAGGAPDPYVQS